MTPTVEAAGMSWVKLDDGFTDHPKIAHVGAIGAWLQIQALCYCNRNLTDGFVPYGVARAFLARGVMRTDDRGVLWTLGEHSGHHGLDLPDIDWPGELVKAGIWEVVAGGYRIHDYDHYQPRKVEVLAERRKHAQRQRNYLRRKADAVSDAVSDAAPVPVSGSSSPDLLPSPDLRSLKLESPSPDVSLAALARAAERAFDEFWKAYPRKVAKTDARKAWAKLGTVPPIGALLDALAWQRELPRWREEGGRYVPHPATYLNGRRWEDERPPLTALERFAAEGETG
jgi:hypothetical protein